MIDWNFILKWNLKKNALQTHSFTDVSQQDSKENANFSTSRYSGFCCHYCSFQEYQRFISLLKSLDVFAINSGLFKVNLKNNKMLHMKINFARLSANRRLPLWCTMSDFHIVSQRLIFGLCLRFRSQCYQTKSMYIQMPCAEFCRAGSNENLIFKTLYFKLTLPKIKKTNKHSLKHRIYIFLFRNSLNLCI